MSAPVTKAAQVGFKALLDLAKRNDAAMADAYAEVQTDILFEVQAVLRRHEVALGDLNISTREFHTLGQQLLREASRSPETDRVRLMAEALAGLFIPDVAVEMKSRVTRAITQLEPTDVVLLRRLRELNGSELDQFLQGHRNGSMVAMSISALTQAGCIQLEPGTTRGPTDVGQKLLQFVQEWQPENNAWQNSGIKGF